MMIIKSFANTLSMCCPQALPFSTAVFLCLYKFMRERERKRERERERETWSAIPQTIPNLTLNASLRIP